MDAVSELHCPRCGWKGLVADAPVGELADRRAALVARHVRTHPGLNASEAEALHREIAFGAPHTAIAAPPPRLEERPQP